MQQKKRNDVASAVAIPGSMALDSLGKWCRFIPKYSNHCPRRLSCQSKGIQGNLGSSVEDGNREAAPHGEFVFHLTKPVREIS